MEISNLHIESLKGYEHNTRTHSEDQIQQIAGSISEFGFTNPILIDGDQRIIAGHGRLYAAKALGMDTVPCISLDHLSDVQVRALVIADNQIAMNAGWDEGLLATELDRLQTDGVDIDLLGFDVDTLEELLKPELIEIEGLTDEDAIPEVEESICQAGDIWVLGEHRLLCGDATRKADVEALMGGEKADMVFTDPPYNVDYEGYTEEKLTIKSDAMSEDEYIKFLSDTFGNYKNSVKRGGVIVCMPRLFMANGNRTSIKRS
jgi:ParB-like chromosome segregation protein Spo0J